LRSDVIAAMLITMLLFPCLVNSLLSTKKVRHLDIIHKNRISCYVRLQSLAPESSQFEISQKAQPSSAASINNKKSLHSHRHNHRLLQSYTSYWETLLQREYQDTVAELQTRRKTYTRSQLEASGLAILSAVASPETELYGEKIVRVTLSTITRMNGSSGSVSEKKLRDKFKRGDALVLTPQILFRGKDIEPKEGLVMDVGDDYLTLGVGNTWPLGLMEMRKHPDTYRVRLDRSLSNVPLRAQRTSLDKLRKGEAGSIANLLVQLFYDEPSSLDVAREEILDCNMQDQNTTLAEQILSAMEAVMADMKFKPNASQQEAVVWALKRKIGLIRGPPGTGKTRVAALLISTALKMNLKKKKEEGGNDEHDEGDIAENHSTRILAVTHSNGAADVLTQALLDMNVPAVRAGRPASVSPSIQHRTIAALSERIPEAKRLRAQAGDVTLDSQTRQSAFYDAAKVTNDAQVVIARTAPVVVASCIGAQQLMASLGEMKDSKPSFPIVVLDEAGQTTEPALITALASAKARQVILVGDTKQLPPTVTTQDAALRKIIGVSPMERLLNNGIDEFSLKFQYRMPASLLIHPNNYFYNGVVKCATTDGTDSDHPPPNGFVWPSPKMEPLAFVEMGNDDEVTHNFGGRSNPKEVEIILDIVKKVIAAGDIQAENIAIITPYSKQVQLFRTELSNASHIHGPKISDINVGTVDSFQGQETDLVIFSAVRSNKMKELGFLRDERRLNVAITRAKRGLIVVGDPSVLRTCKHWTALLDSCSDRGCTLTEGEYKSRSACDAMMVKAVEKKRISLSDVELDMDDEFFGLFPDP